jgi:hypothetical protein
MGASRNTLRLWRSRRPFAAFELTMNRRLLKHIIICAATSVGLGLVLSLIAFAESIAEQGYKRRSVPLEIVGVIAFWPLMVSGLLGIYTPPRSMGPGVSPLPSLAVLIIGWAAFGVPFAVWRARRLQKGRVAPQQGGSFRGSWRLIDRRFSKLIWVFMGMESLALYLVIARCDVRRGLGLSYCRLLDRLASSPEAIAPFDTQYYGVFGWVWDILVFGALGLSAAVLLSLRKAHVASRNRE